MGAVVPHVELSLTDLVDVDQFTTSDPDGEDEPPDEPMGTWAAAVAVAEEPCLLLDSDAVVVAMSPACQELFGLSEPATGRKLLDGVLRLLDFTADGATLNDNEVAKIPPLLALSSGRLARGLIRVQCAEGACTLDAIAAPVGAGAPPSGSLTFVSRV